MKILESSASLPCRRGLHRGSAEGKGREHLAGPTGFASPHGSFKVRSCPVPNYSVVTHELAEINLCLRNLDGAQIRGIK